MEIGVSPQALSLSLLVLTDFVDMNEKREHETREISETREKP
jgi:hypothetical protein